MPIIVQKYGGTSVGGTKRIRNVARRIVAAENDGNEVVAVVSAMGNSTDDLLKMAHEISADPPERELDMLLSTGERVSVALLAMAIHELGSTAISLSGNQAGIQTNTVHTKARITGIETRRLIEELESGKIVLVAGFQGVSPEEDVTTLGRGGSDTTAVALAAALAARECEIYTDVDGVYSADPRIVPGARKLDEISYGEMLEMAATGAAVLMLRSVEYAQKYGVPLHVRSSFSDKPGTWVRKEDEDMEKAVVSAVTHKTDESKLTLLRVPDRPGVAATVFGALAEQNVNVDMIIQNVSEQGTTDISFTVNQPDLPAAQKALDAISGDMGVAYLIGEQMGKVSIIGAGMKSYPGVAAKMFRTLADAGINIEMISTSSIKVSCVIERAKVEQAVKVLHAAFNLGQTG
ncbi:MAG: aspartate kinase [Actinobacteria bacterium]|nr:aspartate kinase [Actinomycetota bacterium]